MSYAQFGEHIWSALLDHPLGSLTKRELELILVRGAIDSGLIEPVPARLAQAFRLGLAKSHGYLTDLALRLPALKDVEGVNLLAMALGQAEVTPDGNHLAIPVNDARLRIWLERNLSTHHLQQGESLRRELIKLTPAALYKILDSAQGLGKPYLAINALSKRFGKAPWFVAAKEHWKPETPWLDAFKDLSISSLASTIPPMLGVVTGLPIAY